MCAISFYWTIKSQKITIESDCAKEYLGHMATTKHFFAALEETYKQIAILYLIWQKTTQDCSQKLNKLSVSFIVNS